MIHSTRNTLRAEQLTLPRHPSLPPGTHTVSAEIVPLRGTECVSQLLLSLQALLTHSQVNNISTSLAQQRPPPVSATPSKDSKSSLSSLNPFSKSTAKMDDKSSSDPTLFPNTTGASRETLLDQAHEWARKAIAHAATIAPPERDQECDIGCAVATHNLGEFFEMQGNYEMAKRKYDEADALGKVLGFEEGRENAREGWKRVDALEKAKTKAAVAPTIVEKKSA